MSRLTLEEVVVGKQIWRDVSSALLFGQPVQTAAGIRIKQHFRRIQQGLGCLPRCLQWIVFDYFWTCLCFERVCTCPWDRPRIICISNGDISGDISTSYKMYSGGIRGLIRKPTYHYHPVVLSLEGIYKILNAKQKKIAKHTRLRSYRQVTGKIVRRYTRKRNAIQRSNRRQRSLNLKLLKQETRAQRRAEWKRIR